MKYFLILMLIGLTCMLSADIIDFNKDFEGYISVALKAKNDTDNGYKKNPKPLSLYWFSDIHGDVEELDHIMTFYRKYNNYFDDVIATGDQVLSFYEEDFSFWNKCGCEKVLQVIGNHEQLTQTKKGGLMDEKPMYDKFFAPYIKDWNVTYTEGTTYYYKDYDNSKIRMVVLDNFIRGKEDEAQVNWFKSVLDETKKKDYSLLIAHHIILPNFVKLTESNWCELDITTDDPYTSLYATIGEYQKMVDDFMTSGGKFIAWIGGHTHFDVMGYSKDYPKQFCYCMDECHRGGGNVYASVMRVYGTKTEDMANALVVDTSLNMIKLIRIGANLDNRMRQRNVFAYDYVNHKIVSQF